MERQRTTVSQMESEADTDTALDSSSTSLPGGEYEVFLSFRGPDNRYTFTDYLYTSLNDVGIHTFRDNEKLRKGEEFGPNLLKAITESRISIPIFSKNYASSKWCLMELTKMLECRRSTGQLISPIFYDVTPEEVKDQSGSYEEAFIEHMKKYDESKVMEWKEALTEVGSFSGWEVKKQADGYQGKLIKNIVQTVLLDLKKKYMFLTDKLVGIDRHRNKMMTLLDVGSNDVRIVGICGMGGIGKTTIAKFIFNKLLPNFERHSFLENVRESAQQHNGLVSLQKQLLAEILGICHEIPNVNSGINMIKDRFYQKKVLLILDDVTERSQFDGLVGHLSWFGPGSKIIISTRNKRVLEALQVNEIYEPPLMDPEQALQLFSMHAFRRKFPPGEYDSISREIASTAAGLPLALEVIGSSLSKDKKETFWKATLKKLKKIPPNEVVKTLTISYQALSFEQKQIFLDIACLFEGMDKTYLFYMWDACGYCPEIEINVLRLMSLIKMEDDNVLWMHDQLRDLGREIVREENFKKPEMRSRVWDHEEALQILEQPWDEKEVEALRLNFEFWSEACFTNEEFVKLRNLRYLQVDGVELDGDFKYLLSKLRWLNWRGCPPKFKPTNFHLKNLVILDLSHSDITEEWEGWSQMKVANKLKVLELASCALRRTPDFSTYKSLEILNLRGCVSLIEIDHSIGALRNLKVLNVSDTHIRNLPDEIWKLEKLELVDATDCYYLKGDIPSSLCIGGSSSLRFLSSSGSSRHFRRI